MLNRLMVFGCCVMGLMLSACDMQGMMNDDNMNNDNMNNDNANDDMKTNGGTDDAGNKGNGDGDGDEKAGDATVILDAITFNPNRKFPDTDPAVVAAGNGTARFTGGFAITVALPGLYADDQFSWMVFAPAVSEITFDGVDVVRIEGYWVHPDDQKVGATMTVMFSDGSETAFRASAAVAVQGALGQPVGFIEPVNAPDGTTIVSITLALDAGAMGKDLAALDVLTLTVLDNAG